MAQPPSARCLQSRLFAAQPKAAVLHPRLYCIRRRNRQRPPPVGSSGTGGLRPARQRPRPSDRRLPAGERGGDFQLGAA